MCLEQDVAPLRQSPRPSAPRRLFLTSLTFNGNLGGLSGADLTCQNVATARGLTGTWRALLAVAQTPPSDRPISDGPYTLLDGGVVFRSRAALGLGLSSALSVTNELGVAASNYVFWSGATSIGGVGQSTCLNWTSASTSTSGSTGGTGTTTNFAWASSSDTCATQRRLLCVQE